MLPPEDIRTLGERRWALPLLSALTDEGGEARFVVLLYRIGCARSALTSSLNHLVKAGWVERNTGHGHPLRPEYVLTVKGAKVAARARQIEKASNRIGIGPETFQRWTLPLAHQLQPAPRRFGQLKDSLIPATPRALSLTLKQMIGDELVSRAIVDDFPPAPLYALTDRGRELASAL